MRREWLWASTTTSVVLCFALGAFGSGCQRPVRFASDAGVGRYGTGAKPKVASRKSGTAVLIGSASSAPGMDQRSGSRGVIVAIDGRKVKKHHPASELSIDAGCHVIEAQFTYKVVKSNNLSACNVAAGIAAVQGVAVGVGAGIGAAAACQDVSKYQSGRQRFAISIQPGKRYEFATLVTSDAVQTYFAEVDPELGTVARHFPVKPGTRTCAAGVPID